MNGEDRRGWDRERSEILRVTILMQIEARNSILALRCRFDSRRVRDGELPYIRWSAP